MKNIKFRGKDRFGNYVYGGYMRGTGGTTIVVTEKSVGCVKFVNVDPESVEQFVGLDADGNELYEGNLFAEGANTYKAELIPSMILQVPRGDKVVPIPLDFFNQSVKQARAEKELGDAKD